MKILETIKIEITSSTRELTYHEFDAMVLKAIKATGIKLYEHHSVNRLYSVRFIHDSIDFSSTVNVFTTGRLAYGLVMANPVFEGSETLHILVDTTEF
jgi:hypothetical protein